MSSFIESIKERTSSLKTVLCVGLDTTLKNIPEPLKNESNPLLSWNRSIIDATQDLACCYKPNLAFYLLNGKEGFDTLKETIEYAHQYNAPVILDAKFGDIGNTAEYYAKAAFETLNADAVTLNPYMGQETIAPFRKYKDKASFILCLTSNVSRVDFQTLQVPGDDVSETRLFHRVADKIRSWDMKQNLGAVIGATAPEELAKLRERLGASLPVLCPGVGAQGGDLEEVLWAGYSGPGSLLINVSRAIANASSGSYYAEASRREALMFVEQIRTFLAQYQDQCD